MTRRKFYLIGCASGIAGADAHSGDGPITIRKSARLAALRQSDVAIEWRDMVMGVAKENERLDEAVAKSCNELAHIVAPLVRDERNFCVVGGDHSSAIGTWSGVYDAVKERGDFGLIWIDAHMDSHTPETSESGRIHGMPLAVLMGYGYPTLTSVMSHHPKVKPDNICLIGVRSFEEGEADLLKRLNVRVYFMDEVKQRGFNAVLREAIEHVNRNTIGYGITLDMDSVDPKDAPGVDVPEAGGIRGDELCEGLKLVANDERLLASEVVEFDPDRDVHHRTENLITDILEILATGNKD